MQAHWSDRISFSFNFASFGRGFRATLKVCPFPPALSIRQWANNEPAWGNR
jgi:hypothetical protein